MAKAKTGGLGKGLDALLSSTASETIQKPAAQEQAVPEVKESATRENPTNVEVHEPQSNVPERKPERILVYDEELEQLAAAEREAIKREQEKQNAQDKNEKPVISDRPSDKPIIEITEEAVASAPVIERIPTKKPTRRTAEGESAKAQHIEATVISEAERVPQPIEKEKIEEILQNKKKYNEDSEIISLDTIVPNPNQPRTRFKPSEIEELAASIEKDGLLQPILVRPVSDGKYEIIAGERRWHACKKAGLKEVPVRIKPVDDVYALELALIENIQRSDLNPIEEAYGYRRIMEHKKVTQSQLAQMVSKGRSTIANSLRLLDLPEDAQQLLYEEKITPGHARAILSVPTAEGKQKLTDKLVAEKLSVRETENIARLLAGREKKETNGSGRTPAPKEFKMVARQLRTKLETNVQVKTVQGKNKIVIEFKDIEDLERLYKSIANE